MTNALRDQNHVATKLGVLYSDPTVTVPIAIDASGYMKVDEVNTIAFTPDQVAIRDEDFQHVLMAVDSTDSSKLCPVFVNSDGGVLIGTS